MWVESGVEQENALRLHAGAQMVTLVSLVESSAIVTGMLTVSLVPRRARGHVEATAHRFDALPHADQPEALGRQRLNDESHPVVDDGQVETVGIAGQLHGDCLGLTVLERVLQRFLHDAENAQGQIGRDARRNALVGERDAGSAVREFSDQRLESSPRVPSAAVVAGTTGARDPGCSSQCRRRTSPLRWRWFRPGRATVPAS